MDYRHFCNSQRNNMNRNITRSCPKLSNLPMIRLLVYVSVLKKCLTDNTDPRIQRYMLITQTLLFIELNPGPIDCIVIVATRRYLTVSVL